MSFFEFLKNWQKGPLVGVEVGVYEGENALRMLGSVKFERLYLVDPYLKFPIEVYSSYGGHTQDEWTAIENRVRHMFSIDDNGDGSYKGQLIKFLKTTSVEASSMFEDSSLDFVYIDGNHAYEYVKQDIECWFNKVKSGGWIMGHDWPYESVQKAVNEFMSNNNLKFNPKSGHLHGWHDWWFQRP